MYIYEGMNKTMIAAIAPLCMRRLIDHVYKWFVGIIFFVDSTNVGRGKCPLPRLQISVTRRQDATRHGYEMRNKRQTQPATHRMTTSQGCFLKFLDNLRQMSMTGNTVGTYILINLSIVRRESETTASTTDARFRINNHTRFDDTC